MSVNLTVMSFFFFLIAGSAFAGSTGALSFASTSFAANQSSGGKTILVSRTGGSSGTASVTCRTFHNTAYSGQEYVGFSHTLSWADGDTSPKHCDVSILKSNPFWGTRSFYMELSAPKGATLGGIAKSTVSIYGEESDSKVSLSSSTYSVKQNAGELTITVERSGFDGGKAMVSYATAQSSALTGTDYSGKHGELTWNAGDAASKTIVIAISNLKPFSGKKTFAIALAGASATQIGTSSAIVTITGDAAAPPAATGEVTLTWTRPTTDTNGEPLTNLAGYKIFYGTSANEFSQSVQVSSPTTLSYEIGKLPKGIWYFAVAAYDNLNVQSELSSTVSKTI